MNILQVSQALLKLTLMDPSAVHAYRRGKRRLLSQGEGTFMGHEACCSQQQELGLGVQCSP